MSFKIIITSPYPQMTSTIKRISEELSLPVTIVEDTLLDAAHKVANLVATGEYEVIVSRAGTAKTIEELTDLPVVHCDNSDFDIMQAFIRAKKLGNKIGFLTYPEEAFPYKMKTMTEVIGFEVTQFPYRYEHELLAQIKAAADLGIDVLVGGGLKAFKAIQDYGMKGMYILTSERVIKRALIRATEVAQYRIAAREKAERLNVVIQRAEEGIMFINKDKNIDMFNPAMEKLFHMPASEVIGKNYRDRIRSPKLKELLERKEILHKEGSETVDGLIITFDPVYISNDFLGTVITCRDFSKIQQLESQIRRKLHNQGLVARSQFSDIVHTSKKMQSILNRAEYFSMTDSTILITGETGTGKELIAQGVHNASKRKDGPFVAVNCAAIPESLLESELFGYADGAFTGAKKGGRAGLFELAHNGTIFLDEIGEISGAIQARLLRVLQEREVMRVGGDRVIPVDIRIIVATNRILWSLVKDEKFRADLFFRINVLRLELPPLRKRKEDIPELVSLFFKKHGTNLTWDSLSEEIRQFFLNYDWPGNIRELENIVERYQLSAQTLKDESLFIEEVINETQLPNETIENRDYKSGDIDEDLIQVKMGTMREIEREIYEKMMEKYDHNQSFVAKKLGVSRTTIWKKINEE